MLLHILQFSLFKASKQGWSSTSCTEFRWWHPLGHGPAMGSKMAADCLCRMRKLSIFSSYVLIITVFIAVFGRQHPPFWCQCSLRQWPNGVSTCAISKIHCSWCSTSLGQQETAVPTMLRAKLCPPPQKNRFCRSTILLARHQMYTTSAWFCVSIFFSCAPNFRHLSASSIRRR